MSNDPRDQPDLYAPDKGYALSGKIMLSAIVILFFVVILMICLHLYARWYLLNARRRQLRRSRHRRRTHIVFQLDSPNPNPITTATRGLDSSVLKSLPVFVYSSRSHPVPLDCAVCLSEFEENESGRVLPKCNHSFHIECIDMWFDSHSTCPLCRSPVEQYPGESENPSHLIISVNEPVTEPSSSSGLCATCQHEEDSVATLSFEERKPRELMGTSMSIEVPVRNFTDGFESESTGCDSTSSQNQAQSSFRSPISRVLSFKRILSRERRGNSPSSVNLSSCGTVAELDVERGREETATRQTQY